MNARRAPRMDPQTLALHWNTAYPVGQLVDVDIGGGRRVRTKTRSAAWVQAAETAVVDVEGLTSAYALRLVTPVVVEAA